MKITLPLSFLLCLPAMAMAADNDPDADAVLLTSTSKFDEAFGGSGKTDKGYERRLGGSGKTGKSDSGKIGRREAKAEKPAKAMKDDTESGSGTKKKVAARRAAKAAKSA